MIFEWNYVNRQLNTYPMNGFEFKEEEEEEMHQQLNMWQQCAPTPHPPPPSHRRTVIWLQHTADSIIVTDFLGIHLGQLWRLHMSCRSMACVIAQRRVQPVVVNGNPLTEHNQLFARAYVCADQQVPSLSGWKSRLQWRRFEEEGEKLFCITDS